MKQNSRNPALCNCSNTSWTIGLRHSSPSLVTEKTGSISFGCSFVADKSLVPRPAAGMTTFLNNQGTARINVRRSMLGHSQICQYRRASMDYTYDTRLRLGFL